MIFVVRRTPFLKVPDFTHPHSLGMHHFLLQCTQHTHPKFHGHRSGLRITYLSYSFLLISLALSSFFYSPAIFFNKSHLDRLPLYIYNHSHRFSPSLTLLQLSSYTFPFQLSLPDYATLSLFPSMPPARALIILFSSYVFPAPSHAYAIHALQPMSLFFFPSSAIFQD